MLAEMLDEALLGKEASLGETVHSFTYFNHDSAIVHEGLEVVLFHDACRNGGEGYAHVFIAIHRSIEVEIFNIHGHVTGAGC